MLVPYLVSLVSLEESCVFGSSTTFKQPKRNQPIEDKKIAVNSIMLLGAYLEFAGRYCKRQSGNKFWNGIDCRGRGKTVSERQVGEFLQGIAPSIWIRKCVSFPTAQRVVDMVFSCIGSSQNYQGEVVTLYEEKLQYNAILIAIVPTSKIIRSAT